LQEKDFDAFTKLHFIVCLFCEIVVVSKYAAEEESFPSERLRRTQAAKPGHSKMPYVSCDPLGKGSKISGTPCFRTGFALPEQGANL
jgi:hypothetical protein